MISIKNINVVLNEIRTSRPLIHNITNIVVSQFTANVLLALGASPAMINAKEEVQEFTRLSNALVINIGTITSSQRTAMIIAAKTASTYHIPWVLDPVGVGTTTYRSEVILDLLQHQPQAIRGNASEIIALNQIRKQQQITNGHGVDSTQKTENALGSAKELALYYQTIISISGETDYITDGTNIISVHNGHHIMPKITGSGCAATAITAACLAVEKNSLLACSAAMTFIGIAGEIAAQKSDTPGTFQNALLDQLYLLNTQTTMKYAKIKIL